MKDINNLVQKHHRMCSKDDRVSKWNQKVVLPQGPTLYPLFMIIETNSNRRNS